MDDATIVDPEAAQPQDWDADMDGDWEAPEIKNPDFKGPCVSPVAPLAPLIDSVVHHLRALSTHPLSSTFWGIFVQLGCDTDKESSIPGCVGAEAGRQPRVVQRDGPDGSA